MLEHNVHEALEAISHYVQVGQKNMRDTGQSNSLERKRIHLRSPPPPPCCEIQLFHAVSSIRVAALGGGSANRVQEVVGGRAFGDNALCRSQEC
jgi:hypothetical protein